VRVLVDAHVLLWWLADSPRLGAQAREAIAAPANEVLVSAATVWEIAIKRALGRLEGIDDLAERLVAEEFAELPIRWSHAMRAGALPRLHDDPFDRMLIAQAQEDGLVLVSSDATIALYDVMLLGAHA
jgi:PIN domain nuclease of toxin-antitoxin system